MKITREIDKQKGPERANGFGSVTRAERPRRSGERGSTLFEFAMVALITLVLMFGLIDLARALYSYHFVTTAAREAARYASVRGQLCSSSVTSCPTSEGDLSAFVTAITPQGIDSTNVTTIPLGLNNLPVCTNALPPYYPGCMFSVTVKYKFSWIFPANLYNLAPTLNMSSTSEMVQSR